jgi:hypothetical protein
MDNKRFLLLPCNIPADFWITTGRRIFCGLLVLLWSLLVGAIVGGLIFLIYIYISPDIRIRRPHHLPIVLVFCGVPLFRWIVDVSKLMWCGGLQWIMQNGVVAFLIVVFWLCMGLLLGLIGLLFLLALVAIFWLFIWDVCFGIDQFDVVKGIAIIPLVCLGILVIVGGTHWLWDKITIWLKKR